MPYPSSLQKIGQAHNRKQKQVSVFARGQQKKFNSSFLRPKPCPFLVWSGSLGIKKEFVINDQQKRCKLVIHFIFKRKLLVSVNQKKATQQESRQCAKTNRDHLMVERNREKAKLDVLVILFKMRPDRQDPPSLPQCVPSPLSPQIEVGCQRQETFKAYSRRRIGICPEMSKRIAIEIK